MAVGSPDASKDCRFPITMGEIQLLRNRLTESGALMAASFEKIARAIFDSYYPGNVWLATFSDLRAWWIDDVSPHWCDSQEIPAAEVGFWEFICKEVLWLGDLPRNHLLELYEKAAEDLRQIDSLISKCNDLLGDDQLEINGLSWDKQNRNYREKYIKYLLELNQLAKEEVISDIKTGLNRRAVALSGRKDMKWRLNYGPPDGWDSVFPSPRDPCSLSDIRHKLLQAPIHEYPEWERLYREDRGEFHCRLANYIVSYNVVRELRRLVDSNYRLSIRAKVLRELIDAYDGEKPVLFTSVVPLQIEGLLEDYCLELGMDADSVGSCPLVDKVNRINASSAGFIDYAYFAFRFPIVRNLVAHGKWRGEDEQRLADLLLLDLHGVCNLIADKDLPTNILVEHLRGIEGKGARWEDVVWCLDALRKVPKTIDFRPHLDFHGLTKVLDSVRKAVRGADFWRICLELTGANDWRLDAGCRWVALGHVKEVPRLARPVLEALSSRKVEEFDRGLFRRALDEYSKRMGGAGASGQEDLLGQQIVGSL